MTADIQNENPRYSCLDPFALYNPERHQDLSILNKIIGAKSVVGKYCAALFSWADFGWLSEEQWPHALPATYTVEIQKRRQQLSCTVQTWTKWQPIQLAVWRRLTQLYSLGINDPKGLVGPARFTPAAMHDRKAQKLMSELRRYTFRTEDEDVPIADDPANWWWLDKPCISAAFDRKAAGRVDQAIMGRRPPGRHSWEIVRCDATVPQEGRSHRTKNKLRCIPVLDSEGLDTRYWLNTSAPIQIMPSGWTSPYQRRPTPLANSTQP
jgi:hypothetical protein